MLSTTRNLKRFFEAVENMDYLDMIYSAEQEATAAERLFYRVKGKFTTQEQDIREYAHLLKGFIHFMRYGVKPSGLSDGDFELFRLICEKVARTKDAETRCLDNL